MEMSDVHICPVPHCTDQGRNSGLKSCKDKYSQNRVKNIWS